ncbi:MAG TPA: (2Fe-2S)-binding protein [Bacteroidetes bacterium]|nr:(2Fe-2S)-binding protein [Bacteroidota bacterium]
MELKINGKTHTLEVEANMPLLWALRDELNLTGTKYGCGISSCGACTVLLDGVATKTCTLPVNAAAGKEIKTIEGVAKNGNLSAVQKAWIAHQVPQCGYCQSGMIMAAEALLDTTPDPTDEEIDSAINNICRCGTYQRIRAAVHTAAKFRMEAEASLLGSL